MKMPLGDIFRRAGSAAYRGIKRCDLYSQDIKLTYEGKSSFKTFYGGVVSIFILAL